MVKEVEDVIGWLLGLLSRRLLWVGKGTVRWELVVIGRRREGVGSGRGVGRGIAEALGEGGGDSGDLAEDACEGVVVRDCVSWAEGVWGSTVCFEPRIILPSLLIYVMSLGLGDCD